MTASEPASSNKRSNDLPPMVSFVAPSGTGKTTLVEQVVAALIARGFLVGAVKHDAHRIELDTEGKDSWRLRQAGAETLLVGANQAAWMSDAGSAPALDDLVRVFFGGHDIVIVEGYRSARLPVVVVQRPEVHDATWQWPDHDCVLATLHPSEVDRAVAVVIDHFGLS